MEDEIRSEAELPADEAIERLIEDYGGRLYGLGLRLCGNPQDAQDMVQETFTNAWRKWDQFEGRASPKTWLFTIASRVCIRMHRPKAGQPDHIASLEELLPPAEAGIPDPDALHGAPFAAYLRQEARDVLGRALSELDPDFRMPLILKDIFGLSLVEIGRILDVKPATVKTRVHRARLKLREVLVAGLPTRPIEADAAGPDRVCLDLLEIKLEAMDRGQPFPLPDIELAERCRALHETLDMTRDVCRAIGEEDLPDEVRDTLLRACRAGVLPTGEGQPDLGPDLRPGP